MALQRNHRQRRFPGPSRTSRRRPHQPPLHLRLSSSFLPRKSGSKTAHQRLILPNGPCRRLRFRWAQAISPAEWAIYSGAMEVVRAAGIPFMLGGGFALAAFTGRWRDTKDIDFYIHPRDRQATVTALAGAGFVDYFSRLSYDRKWIYRSVKSDVIVDIIWSMANQRA